MVTVMVREVHHCWLWKWRKRVMNQGLWVASESWEGEEIDSPEKLQKGSSSSLMSAQ